MRVTQLVRRGVELVMTRRLSLVCGIAALLSACSSTGGLNCTDIGCSDGLVVELTGAPPGPWSISVSSQGTTHAQDCAAGGNCGGVMFFEGFLPQLVTVTVTRGSNTVTYFNQAPTPRTFEPNGPRCGPSCNQPRVTVQPPAP